MKEIKLTKGYVTLVDDEDFEYLNTFSWHVAEYKKTNYALTTVYGNNKWATVRMHRLIMNTPKGLDVDHINRDGLDNRKCNLRNVTRRENTSNSCKNSKHIGVYKVGNTYYSRIYINKKQVYLGSFKNIEDAELAYKSAIIREHHITAEQIEENLNLFV